VVEIGSNDGSFLKFFQEDGINVLGVDPALEVAKKAVASGVDTLPSYFTVEVAREILQDFGSARVICANNVFAHIDNLRAVVDGVYHLMSDDGVFVFEVSYLV
jgi:2-polyprenyl-3-methyl-5-hydroxy-6-metoxy-1,4-benzoquinol methylase